MNDTKKTTRSYSLLRMAVIAAWVVAAGGCATQSPLALKAERSPAGGSATYASPIKKLASEQITDDALNIIAGELKKRSPRRHVINGLLDAIAQQREFTPEQVSRFSEIMKAAPERLKKVVDGEYWWHFEIGPSFEYANYVMQGATEPGDVAAHSLKDFMIRLETRKPKSTDYRAQWSSVRDYENGLLKFEAQTRIIEHHLMEEIPHVTDSEISEVVDMLINPSVGESIVATDRYSYYLKFSEVNPKLRTALTDRLFSDAKLSAVEKYKIASKYGLLDWLVEDSLTKGYSKEILRAIFDGTLPSSATFSKIGNLIQDISAERLEKYGPALAEMAAKIHGDNFTYVAIFLVKTGYSPEKVAAEAANRILRMDFTESPQRSLRRAMGDTEMVQRKLFPILNSYFEINKSVPRRVVSYAFNPDYYEPLAIDLYKGTTTGIVMDAVADSIVNAIPGVYSPEVFAVDVRNPKHMQWITMKAKAELNKKPSFVRQCLSVLRSIF